MEKSNINNNLERNSSSEHSKNPNKITDEKLVIDKKAINSDEEINLNKEKMMNKENDETSVNFDNENNGELLSSLDEAMVSLEELSQNNDEFYSAKEFNFGIDEVDEIINKQKEDDSKRKNDEKDMGEKIDENGVKKNDNSCLELKNDSIQEENTPKTKINLNDNLLGNTDDLKSNVDSASSLPIDSLDEKVASSLQNIGSSDEFMSSSSFVSRNKSDEAALNSESCVEKVNKQERDSNNELKPDGNTSFEHQTGITNVPKNETTNATETNKNDQINSHDQEQVNFQHFKDLDCLKENSSDDSNQITIPTVASITTSVIQVPCTENIFHTINEIDHLSKNSLDSLENDSLNSVGCVSAESPDCLDRINPVIRKIPEKNTSQEDTNRSNKFIDDEIESNKEYNSNKYPIEKKTNGMKMNFPIDIQTCGKCDESLSRQLEKSSIDKESHLKFKNDKKQANGDKTNGHQNDIFQIKNGCYHTLDASRSPRGSEQFDDGPYITDISPEKRGSIFAKMSTLPLDGSDTPGGKDFNSSCLLHEDDRNIYWRKFLAQVLAVSAKNTLALNFGLSIGFQTIAIPYLSKPNDDLYLNKEQISLFGSLFFTVIPVGCLLSGPTIHGWGRKKAMLFFCLPLFIGWCLYYLAKSPAMLYAAILLLGLVNGLLEAPVLTYVAEVTEAKWRGALASSSSVAALIGVFIQLLLGNFFEWRTVAAITSVFPIISFISICFVPESPHWLAGKGREDDVEKSLMWLRGWTDKASVALEVESLMVAHKQPKSMGTPLSWKAYTSRTFVEPFLIVLIAFAIGHFSGMATVQTYAVEIFDKLGVSGWSWTAGLGATQVLGALACVIILPFIGKRPIATLSMTGVAIGMTAAATCSSSLAASGLLLANFCTNACSRVIPWVLVGEVFTNEMRAVASGLTSCLAYAIGFGVSYSFLEVQTALTLRGLLGVYALVGLIGALAYYSYLPETEGKSLAEVQEHFAKKCNRRVHDNLAFEKDKP